MSGISCINRRSFSEGDHPSVDLDFTTVFFNINDIKSK